MRRSSVDWPDAFSIVPEAAAEKSPSSHHLGQPACGSCTLDRLNVEIAVLNATVIQARTVERPARCAPIRSGYQGRYRIGEVGAIGWLILVVVIVVVAAVAFVIVRRWRRGGGVIATRAKR